MKISIPYTSLVYPGNYEGGRNQYLENLLLSVAKIPDVEDCSVFGAPGSFRKQFIEGPGSTHVDPLLHWKYMPRFKKLLGNRLHERLLKLSIGDGGIVHSPFGPAFFEPDARSIITVHDIYHDEYTPLYSFSERMRRRRIYETTLHSAARVVAVSEHVKKAIVTNYNVEASNISVIHNSCHPVHFQSFDDAFIEEVRREYFLPEQFVFYPSVKWPFKNHSKLLDAISILRDNDFPDLELVLTGSWGSVDNESVRPLKNRIHSTEWVHDYGQIPYAHLPVFYRLASAMVSPSLIEGFGLPLIEAMANSCPIACSGIEVFEEVAGNAALFFDPLDPEDITLKIRSILDTDGNVRAGLIEKGRKRIQNFTVEKIAADLLNVYKSVEFKK